MSRKILIIDDDLDLVKLIGAHLQASGYEVFAAFDGIRAISQAREKKPDLIILDIKLPAGSGLKVYDTLQNSFHTSLIPILLVSGEDNIKGELEKCNNPYLLKPFGMEELLVKDYRLPTGYRKLENHFLILGICKDCNHE